MNANETKGGDELSGGAYVEVIKVENAKRTRAGKLRNDIHRRGAFQPEFYTFFGYYYLGLRGGNGVMKASARIQEFLASEEAQDFKALQYGEFGKCGVCGARFAMGEIWQHSESMDLVHVGCDCCVKYNMVSGTDWNAVRDERERALKAQKTAARRSKERTRILAAYPGLEQALATDHYISRDLARKFENDGTLSERQIAFAFKLQGEVATKIAQRAAEVNVAAPTGRVTVRGVVVSRKEQETAYGLTQRMTVKVHAEGGVWLAWGTVPSNIAAELRVGDEVEFDGALEPSSDKPHFAFFKRPTKANIIKQVQVAS